MAKEKIKGLPWLRESFMAKAEERRIAKLYGRRVSPHFITIQRNPSIVTFAPELDDTFDNIFDDSRKSEIDFEVYLRKTNS